MLVWHVYRWVDIKFKTKAEAIKRRYYLGQALVSEPDEIDNLPIHCIFKSNSPFTRFLNMIDYCVILSTVLALILPSAWMRNCLLHEFGQKKLKLLSLSRLYLFIVSVEDHDVRFLVAMSRHQSCSQFHDFYPKQPLIEKGWIQLTSFVLWNVEKGWNGNFKIIK